MTHSDNVLADKSRPIAKMNTKRFSESIEPNKQMGQEKIDKYGMLRRCGEQKEVVWLRKSKRDAVH